MIERSGRENHRPGGDSKNDGERDELDCKLPILFSRRVFAGEVTERSADARFGIGNCVRHWTHKQQFISHLKGSVM